MRIRFLGAAGTTTGSMHLVEAAGARVLLDCGLYQGRRKQAFERNRNLPPEALAADACVLSHAHIDHSGNLPTLVRRGFQGPILATPATRDLCAIMLADSAHIQVKDVAYVNKRRRREGRRPFEPLYVPEDAERALARFRTVPYAEAREVAPGVTLTFLDAGHILGSAVTVLDLAENGRARRLVYTGDLGRRGMPILRDPVVPERAQVVLTESTYGNRLHPEREDVKGSLEELCRRIAELRSRLVIPAFSVGRTQQILYFLRELWREGRLREIPVYVDSPLATRATDVHEAHPECYDAEARKLFRRDEEPFDFGRVRYVADADESKRLNRMEGPVIILSASGMCEAGRVLHHLKHSVADERNAVLIVGYQAEHTLGRRLVRRESPVRIFGREYPLRAEVRSIQALSAHADRGELLDYFRRMDALPERAFVVHGEPDQSGPFAEALRGLGVREVTVPAQGEEAEA